MRPIQFKTSVAVELFGNDIKAKRLFEIVGRPKPQGQHHMRYTPADLAAARYRLAGIEPEATPDLLPQPQVFPPLIITRMTKGGVGKTSVSVNLACTLAMMGYRVLFVDADAQGSATALLGVDANAYDSLLHIGHFLLKKSVDTPDADLSDAIMPIYEGGYLDLIPADITLSESDSSLVGHMGFHERAYRFFRRNSDFLNQRYDAIVVDTAPGTTPVCIAFTYAAKRAGKIMTVVEPEGTCLRALESLTANLAEIKAYTESDIGMEVIVNKYQANLKHVRESMPILYGRFANSLNDTIIPQCAGFARQIDPDTKNATPLIESEPGSIGSKAIISIAHSVVRSFGICHPGLSPESLRGKT